MMQSSLPQPDGLLFDLDGVIADVRESYLRCIIETAADLGCVVSESDVETAKRRGRANNDWVLTRELLLERGIRVDLDEVTRIFQNRYLGSSGQPGARERERLLAPTELLQSLTTRYPSAIVTGRPRDEAEWFLGRFDISQCFRSVVAMEDAPLKPAPAGVLLAMKRLGITRPWMLGDTPDDMTAATAAGVVPVGVTSIIENEETRRALIDSGARLVISNIREIPRYLD